MDPQDVRAVVSGATGFLGTALLPHLGGSLAVVLRGGDVEARARRLARTTDAEVVGVGGDVRRERWGLDAELDRLAGAVDVVVNLAAETSWAAPWARLHRTNVLGALHGAELAATLRVPYVHVSSHFAAFTPSGAVPQRLVPEAPHLTDYERSKCRAEWLLDARCRDVGVPCRIVRVGGLSGDIGSDVTARRRRTAPLGALLREYAPRWLPYAPDARCDLCPRNLVGRGLARVLGAPVPTGVSVLHLGLGDRAPTAAALLHEARVVDDRRSRPLAVPARLLLEASAQANRFRRTPRSAAVIGLRYLASSAVFESDRLEVEPSLGDILRSLGVSRPVGSEPLGDFYGDW